MKQACEHIHYIKAVMAVKDALMNSLKGEAEKDKRELETDLFDKSCEFVNFIMNELELEYGKKEE